MSDFYIFYIAFYLGLRYGKLDSSEGRPGG